VSNRCPLPIILLLLSRPLILVVPLPLTRPPPSVAPLYPPHDSLDTDSPTPPPKVPTELSISDEGPSPGPLQFLLQANHCATDMRRSARSNDGRVSPDRAHCIRQIVLYLGTRIPAQVTSVDPLVQGPAVFVPFRPFGLALWTAAWSRLPTAREFPRASHKGLSEFSGLTRPRDQPELD
jgi:hypothetical protein